MASGQLTILRHCPREGTTVIALASTESVDRLLSKQLAASVLWHASCLNERGHEQNKNEASRSIF